MKTNLIASLLVITLGSVLTLSAHAETQSNTSIVETELQPVDGVADMDWERLKTMPLRNISAGLQVLFYTYLNECGTGKAAKVSKHVLTAQLLASFVPEDSLRPAKGAHVTFAAAEGALAFVNLVNMRSSLKRENKWDGLCDGVLTAMLAYNSVRNLYEGAQASDPAVDDIAAALNNYVNLD